MKMLLLICLLVLPLQAQAWVEADGERLVVEGQPFRMKGISLGNWFVPEGYMFGFEKAVSPRQIQQVFAELLGPGEAEKFWQTYYDRYVTQEDLRRIRQAGFNTVRLPLHHALLDDLTRVDRCLAWCKQNDLYLLLDLHAAPGGQTGENIDDGWSYPWLFESETDQQRTIALWRRLAERYQDEPAILGYELLNEPIPNYPEYKPLYAKLEPFYVRATRAIREVDKRHLIFLDGAGWASDFSCFGKPFDPGLVYAFHRYWTEPDVKGLEPYLALQKRWDVPIVMDESGENTDAWIATFRASLEQTGVGWSFWPYKKLDATSCVVSIAPPAHWDQIKRYADAIGMTSEEKRKLRPPANVSRQALAELLDNVRVEKCRPNPGFVKALGL